MSVSSNESKKRARKLSLKIRYKILKENKIKGGYKLKFFNISKYRISMVLILVMVLQLFMPVIGEITYAENSENSITHEVETLDENCERKIRGKLNFKLPELEKKKVDLVIVQDASGSFKETIGTMKNGLKEVIDRLRPEDRAMLVTYGGGHEVQWYSLDYEGRQHKSHYANFANQWPNLNISTN